MRLSRYLLAAFVSGSFGLSGCVDLTSQGPEEKESQPPAPSEPAPTEPPEAMTSFGLTPKSNKNFTFSWPGSPQADYYELLENPDGMSGFTQLGDDIPATEKEISVEVPLHERFNAEYIVSSCNAVGCNDSDVLQVDVETANQAIGFIKDIKNVPWSYNYFANAIDVSSDGTTLVIGQRKDDVDSTGASADPTAPVDNTNMRDTGAVHVYHKENGFWTLDSYLKSENPDVADYFGTDVAVSSDGNTLVTSARREGSIDPLDPSNNGGVDVGAIYVFERTNGVWARTAYLKGDYASLRSNLDIGDAVAISDDGQTIAFSVQGDRSTATTVNGDQNDDSAGSDRGAIWVYAKDGSGNWVPEAYLKRSYPDGDGFGDPLDMSGDGSTIVAGIGFEDSCDSKINGTQANDGCSNTGAALVFEKDPGTGVWSESTFLKPSNIFQTDLVYGWDVSISKDGSTIAVGAYADDSLMSGIDPVGMTNDGNNVGSVYVYRKELGTWVEDAYIKPKQSLTGQKFGDAVTLDGDGDTLVVGSVGDRGDGAGIEADQPDGTTYNSGAVYVYKKRNSVWSLQSYMKAPNPDQDDRFGSEVAVSFDGGTIFVQAPEEDGPDFGGGIDNPQYSDNSGADNGAVYIY